jgi:hypothetical protein
MVLQVAGHEHKKWPNIPLLLKNMGISLKRRSDTAPAYFSEKTTGRKSI